MSANQTKNAIHNTPDYALYLNRYGIRGLLSGTYYQCGEPQQSQGWILHISVIPTQAEDLFEAILPILAASGCAFKIIKDKKQLMYLNAGFHGFVKIGKVVSLYPENEEQALSLVEQLHPVLKAFKGPAIPTDFSLGAVLYTRYGSFQPGNSNSSARDANTIITDGFGRRMADEYFIPAKVPEGISNPFGQYLRPQKHSGALNILHKKYQVQEVIVNSAKGNVLLALKKNGATQRKCIIKHGRENMISDDFGRDMRDRLKWQFEVHQQLKGDIAIPEVYDYLEIEGDGLLCMEFIQGRILNTIIMEIYSNSLWPYLPIKPKKELLGYLKQILVYTQKIHDKGYIHRDITSNNFIITKNKKVYCIDLELAYSVKNSLPNPAFESATLGYASPGQIGLKTPTIQDDIHAAGALMIMLFTGLEPMLLIEQNTYYLREKLTFLIKDTEIVSLIIQCVDEIPDNRPSLSYVTDKIKTIERNYGALLQKAFKDHSQPDPETSDIVIQKALNGLGEHYMLSPEGLWASGASGNGQLDANGMINRGVSVGVYEGIGGILYLLSKAKACGFNITNLDPVIKKAWEYCEEHYLPQLNQLPQGLYFGKAGIATMIATVKENGLLPVTDYFLEKSKECFSSIEKEPNIIQGIAGQGVGLLHCRTFAGLPEHRKMAYQYVSELIRLQQKDGAWINTDAQGNPGKQTGFCNGIAGIIYFLLEYYTRFRDQDAWYAAQKGLSYLEKTAIKSNASYLWPYSDTNEAIGPWWCDGVPGIALSFLKAFQLTGDPNYRFIAEKALDALPPVFVHYNLSQYNGISGLGEIYLEAAGILQSAKYREKANWIANLLLQLKMHASNDTYVWCTGNSYYPVPDLMTGCSGVIHFLLRSRFPGKLALPLLFRNV